MVAHLPIFWTPEAPRRQGFFWATNVAKCINSPSKPRRLQVTDHPEDVTCRRCRNIAHLDAQEG